MICHGGSNVFNLAQDEGLACPHLSALIVTHLEISFVIYLICCNNASRFRLHLNLQMPQHNSDVNMEKTGYYLQQISVQIKVI